MARSTMFLLAFVCLLVTGEWFMTMTSSTFIDAYSNSDFPVALRDSPVGGTDIFR